MPSGVYQRHRRNPGVTEKIKTAQILTRLEKNFLGELDPPLTRDQIRCGEVLLRKVLPDLSTHHIDGQVTHNFVEFLRGVEQLRRSDALPAPVVDVLPITEEVRH